MLVNALTLTMSNRYVRVFNNRCTTV